VADPGALAEAGWLFAWPIASGARSGAGIPSARYVAAGHRRAFAHPMAMRLIVIVVL
jgi:hypothetical protein